ncbi:DoxX-like protein [Actinoallomurus bryophytorum]|uniref:DoxX-like protein n=1 Tax=Actinoallomurus bryophytorum TaxID=1490222 RepID=A0A543CMX9_9ACTN|nr:DoxX family protein [Actinoallomurus bryophytorum]TQL98465.1 DoxX-like protein [Actinoallomurus bryophytorum]
MSGLIRAKAVYWVATLLVAAELGVGGAWDVSRTPQVRDLVDHLGYPPYFLVILGTWKLLGMIALLAPRFPLLKEWAYAGVIFTDTGAIASHLIVGYGSGELAILIPLALLTALSWSLRPADRRVSSLARSRARGGGP